MSATRNKNMSMSTKMKPGLHSDLLLYGVLLTASLSLAWWASTPKSASDEHHVRLASIPAASISEVVWQGANQTMTARRREGDGRFWVQYGTDSFLASERFEQALNFFDPLEAKRMVTKTSGLSEEQWKAFGLKPASSKLTLKFKKENLINAAEPQSWSIELGANSFGTTDRYGMTPDGKNVVLLDTEAISGFDNAVARFFDRAVLSKKIDDADAAELAKGSSKKRFDRQATKPAGKDKAPFDGAFNDWLEKFERLRAIRYADQGTEEKLAALEPELILKIMNGSRVSEEIAVKKMSDSGTEIGKSGSGNASTWWVFSSDAKAHIEISANRAEPVVKDAESLF